MCVARPRADWPWLLAGWLSSWLSTFQMIGSRCHAGRSLQLLTCMGNGPGGARRPGPLSPSEGDLTQRRSAKDAVVNRGQCKSVWSKTPIPATRSMLDPSPHPACQPVTGAMSHPIHPSHLAIQPIHACLPSPHPAPTYSPIPFIHAACFPH